MQNMNKVLQKFKNGDIVVIFDSKDRENEADLFVSIEKLTPDKVNFLAKYGRGLICASLSEDIVTKKGLPLMPNSNSDPYSTAFTLSVDSKKTRTGISPKERYITAMDLIDDSLSMKDFVTPGHLFPLIAKNGGILERQGHTEAAVSLCKWTGLKEGALICEMVKDDGNMLSLEEAKEFAQEYNLGFCTVSDLIEYQKLNFTNVREKAKAKLTTSYGVFDITVYEELFQPNEHVFLSMGDYTKGVVRIHSECLTGDIFSSKTCDCGNQLHEALQKIADDGRGAIVYLRQEGRGIGLSEKIKAYNLQQTKGMDTVEANLHLGHQSDARDYHQAAWILKEQGYKKVKLLTNNPTKANFLKRHGIEIEIINTQVHSSEYNIKYLKTKKDKMGHELDL